MSAQPAFGMTKEPEDGLPRILFRLRTQGPSWIWKRLLVEWNAPTTRPGIFFRSLLQRGLTAAAAPFRSLRRSLASHLTEVDSTLYAFYDLKVQPVTFDALWFLTGADLERRRLGLERVHVVIVPGPAGGLREEDPGYEEVVEHRERQRRVYRILMGTFRLLRSCSSFTMASGRADAAAIRSFARHVYPGPYETALPAVHHPDDTMQPSRAGVSPIAVLRADEQELGYVDRWLESCANGRRLVAITLRDYDYMPARNSNIAAWAEFARRLDPARYFPVFVLDTEQTLYRKPALLDDQVIFREVSWDVGLRAALYERAWLNLGVNNGPMGLCWLNERTRYITFKMLTPDVPQSTLKYMRERGFEANQSLPFVTPFQCWVWEDDALEVIEREFAAMAARIEASGRAGGNR